MMNYRNYSTTIQKVSEIGLGTWQLGDDFCWKSVSEKEATTIVEKPLTSELIFLILLRIMVWEQVKNDWDVF